MFSFVLTSDFDQLWYFLRCILIPLMELDVNGQPGIGHDAETAVLIGGICSPLIVAPLCMRHEWILTPFSESDVNVHPLIGQEKHFWMTSDELADRRIEPCFCVKWLCKYWSLVKYLLHKLHLLFDGEDRPFWHALRDLYLLFRDSSMVLAPSFSTLHHLFLESATTCQSGWIRKACRSLDTQSRHRSFGLCCGRLPDVSSPNRIIFGSLWSSILQRWPNHLNLDRQMRVEALMDCDRLRIDTFEIWSKGLTLSACRRQAIWKVLIHLRL